MEDWFTIDKVDDTTFAISEYKHWEQTHCYLLIGSEKALLIDTGLGVGNIDEVVRNITDKPIEVITTHVHWDHIGGHKYFSHIIVHEKEKSWIEEKFPIPLQVVKNNLMKESCEFPSEFSIDKYKIYKGASEKSVKDKDVISLGNRKLQVIHTPGHSPGHICLYEEAKGYLFSGDLIYKGTLYAFYPSTDPYDFMQSVKKLKELHIKRILPGHNELSISVELLHDIYEGFNSLYRQGKLYQGNGIFQFKSFNIHI